MPVFLDLNDGAMRNVWAREQTDPTLTIGETCRLYAVHYLKERPSRVQFERIYKQFSQQWEDRPLGARSRKEVTVWHMGLSSIPGHANKALTFLRRIYNVALDMEAYDGKSPTFRVPLYFPPRRERFLSLEEMERFMEGIPHLPPKHGAYFLTLVLTAARLTELRCMRWTDVEWSARLWKKPRTKNGTSHFLPLPLQVVEALSRLPRTSEWVFPGLHGQPWTRCAIDRVWQLARRRWNMGDVTIHDLRRTCASYLAIEGENLPTIQRVLNHKSLVHTAIYARLNTKATERRSKPKRIACAAWCQESKWRRR